MPTSDSTKYNDAYFENAIKQMPDEYHDLFTEGEIKQHNPIKLQRVNPSDYSLILFNKEMKPMSLDRSVFITFLRNNYIVRVGKLFRKFDGRRYAPMSDSELSDFIYDSAYECGGVGFVPRQSDVNDVVKASSSLLCKPITPITDIDLSDYEDAPLVAYQNGVYNMKTHRLLPFTPFYPINHVIRADFDPTVTDAPARAIIEGIIPNPQTRDFLYEMIGYILFEESLNPPAIFLLYGPAETGKSALATMIESLVGLDSVTHMNMRQLTARFGPSDLEGKLLNVCKEAGGESAKTTEFNGELLKNMSSGEVIQVEQKHKPLYEIKPTAKVLFCTNTIPDFGDDSSGLYRRLYIIPCRQPQDTKLRIYDGLTQPDSLTWVVNKAYQAYQLFKANGKFSQSPQMDKEKMFFKSQNSMMDFLHQVFGTDDREVIVDRIVNDEELRYTVNLYSAYQEFSRASLNQPLSRKKFVEKIRNEYNLDIVNEGYYLSDGRHSTRDKYVKGTVV